MRSPAIKACGSARRGGAAPCDPVQPRIAIVEDLDERRVVELRDDGRVHRSGGLPRREAHAGLHVPIDPDVRAVFLPRGRRDVREPRVWDVREVQQERIARSVPRGVHAAESEDRGGALMVRHDEAARVLPRPVCRVQGGWDCPFSPTREGRRRRDAGDRVGGEEEAADPEDERAFSTAKAREVEQAEEADSREDREGDHQVLRVSVRNQDARGRDDPDDRGTEERNEPAIHLKPVREEIAKWPARGREGQEEDQRDEVEEAARRHLNCGPWHSDDDRDDADHHDRPQDHDEKEVEREVVRRDERRRDEEERHHCSTVRPKTHETKEARDGEELPDGCRRRMRRRICDRDCAGEERGREEGETIVAGHPTTDEEHREDRERAEDGDEQVDRRRHVLAAEVDHSGLSEEHPREVRMRHARAVVRGRDASSADERSQDREVLAGIGAPVEEGPERREPHRDRDERDRGQRDGGRLPHSLANRPPLLKGYPRSVARPENIDANYFSAAFLSRAMARRCPECYAELPEDAVWVCPTCKYTLRTPAAAKAGIVFMVLGLALLGAFVYGPDQIGLRSGLVPTDLANVTIANFPLLVLGAFGVGAFLVATAALKIRSEQAKVLAA